MCREHEQINLNQVGEDLFDKLDVSEGPDDEDPLGRTETVEITKLYSPDVISVDRDDGSPPPDPETKSSASRLSRLIVTLLIGFAFFSIERYLFDFPEFQSEINRHTQLLGGLTAVGGVALLTRTNWR